MSAPSKTGQGGDVVYFGPEAIEAPGLVCRTSAPAVIAAADAGGVRALVVDARSADSFFRAAELLRALFDDPRRPRRTFAPERVLALIATGDVEAAFAFGRYGIAGLVEEDAFAELEARLHRILVASRAAEAAAAPLLAPPRTPRLGFRADHELPSVSLAHRHPPETQAALAHYVARLREAAGESTVFADVATLVEVVARENLTFQTNLATKAGAAYEGQFTGSFEFYRELRRTRYGRIPDHPTGAIAMEVFISIDEVLHEVLHLLFFANERRAGLAARHHRIAEEFSVTWWQGLVHRQAFPEWLDGRILEINDDFMFCADNQVERRFWEVGHVFADFAGYPWVPYLLAQLPARTSYVGVRPDLDELCASFERRPEAVFFLPHARERLAVPVAFASYPPVPAGFRVATAQP